MQHSVGPLEKHAFRGRGKAAELRKFRPIGYETTECLVHPVRRGDRKRKQKITPKTDGCADIGLGWWCRAPRRTYSAGLSRRSGSLYTQPVGFGRPPHLQMSFMGPFLKVP
jgi:hypothetical protein